MVETDGTCSSPASLRWKWMVAAPASKPADASSRSELDDPLLDLGRCAMGDVARGARAGRECLVAAFTEAPHHLAHPALRHPVGPSHLTVAASLDEHGLDHVARQIHRNTPSIGVHDVPTQVSTMW